MSRAKEPHKNDRAQARALVNWSSASVGKARFCHRCRRLATERRAVFSRRSRGQEGHAERDL